MNATHSFLLTALALLVVDIPWLTLIGGPYGEVVQKIQGGRPMVTRPLAGIPVYFALAYLVLKAESVQEAFLIGMTTYAVYDFTVMAVFKEYTLGIALADTLWGGLLFGIVYFLKKKFQF
jgi:uncharacterized membrane protein